MILTISSNTYHHNDGQPPQPEPLDFVLNLNHSQLSFYSQNTIATVECNPDLLWSIIESGDNSGFGGDTAIHRKITVIKVTGSRYDRWTRKDINYEILINHHNGNGQSAVLNILVPYITTHFSSLHPDDIQFLNKLKENT
jgi:hypothetical protein